MIDPELEKNLALSTQDVYDICDFAVQAAYDDGFMNSFIFERALYVFAAIRLYEDIADELSAKAANNINSAWSYLLEENIIQEMQENYHEECDFIAKVGIDWYSDYESYAHSARGLLNTIQTFTGDIVAAAADQFNAVNAGSDIQNVIDIADKWGMNNAMPHDESLFGEDE